MYIKILSIAVMSVFSIASFAASEVYNSSTDARIRLFGQNQLPTIMQSNIDCKTNPKGTKINVGGSAGDAFKSFTRTVGNTTIGMPETIVTQNISQHDGILSKAFYKEIIIKADQPVNVRGGFIGLSTVTPSTTVYQEGCSSKTVSFIPKAGRDYEVLSSTENKQCSVQIKEIVIKNRQTQYEPVTMSSEFICKK